MKGWIGDDHDCTLVFGVFGLTLEFYRGSCWRWEYPTRVHLLQLHDGLLWNVPKQE